MFLDPDSPFAAEALKEAGEAYFAACKKMVASLEALRAFDRAVDPAARENERAARRSRLLDDAAERVLCVLIQREAMRLSGTQTFLEDYGVAEEVIARMGQGQRR
jgi:hypothetical protein